MICLIWEGSRGVRGPCDNREGDAGTPAYPAEPSFNAVHGSPGLRFRNNYRVGGDGLAQDVLENQFVDLLDFERRRAGEQRMDLSLTAEPSVGELMLERSEFGR